MSKALVLINALWAILDTIICCLAVCAFGWGAYYFDRWWLLLFLIVPLAVFNQHSLILDSDIQRAKMGATESNGSEVSEE